MLDGDIIISQFEVRRARLNAYSNHYWALLDMAAFRHWQWQRTGTSTDEINHQQTSVGLAGETNLSPRRKRNEDQTSPAPPNPQLIPNRAAFSAFFHASRDDCPTVSTLIITNPGQGRAGQGRAGQGKEINQSISQRKKKDNIFFCRLNRHC